MKNIVFFLALVLSACHTDIAPTQTCKWHIAELNCRDSLFYIPEHIDGSMAFDSYKILPSGKYSKVSVKYDNVTAVGYVMNRNLQYICRDTFGIFMDSAKVYPYEKGMFAVSEADKIVSDAMVSDKVIKRRYKFLERMLRR